LQKVVTNGTGKAAQELGRPAAGKTGTTNDNKSALFAGFTPELAAAVMFTKDGPDGTPISLAGTGDMESVTGGSFPARIWTAFMKGALQDLPVTKFAPLPKGQPNGAKPTSSPSGSPTPSASLMPTTPAAPSPSPTQVYVTVSDYQGVARADAQADLTTKGLVVVIVEQSVMDPNQHGVVIAQDFIGEALPGATITLTVGIP
jgi:membrane peptidoglycan carboxypeptidase